MYIVHGQQKRINLWLIPAIKPLHLHNPSVSNHHWWFHSIGTVSPGRDAAKIGNCSANNEVDKRLESGSLEDGSFLKAGCVPVSARHGAGHVPHRPSCHPNCGGGGDVLHHFLRLHRRPQREHSPPQDGNSPKRRITITGGMFSFQ